MTRQYDPEFQETCPCCKQPVLKIPLEYQCEYSDCEKLGEYEAWFGEGLIRRANVCEEHLKLSKGYKALVNSGLSHFQIMEKIADD
jgi:hypothetical protein